MKRVAHAVALAVLLSSTGSARQTFRSGVDIVRVDALVTDGRRPIAGLTAADFELRDNGVIQAIDSAESGALPLSVIFVLDVSGSVAGPKMLNLNAAVDLFLKGLDQSDRAALVTFSHRVWLRTPLGTAFSGLRAVLSGTEAAGGTALHDAVYAGLALSDVQDSRPLLVVFSDGLDNTSWLSADIVRDAARRANAVVYGISVAAGTRSQWVVEGNWRHTVLRPQYVKGQTDFLEAVASATGGRVLKADTTDRLPVAFEEIVKEFRTRYLITYSPRGVETPGWHQIAVKVKRRFAAVQARSGYQK